MIGMLLDQQVPMEWAFRAPLRLRERLDGRLGAPRSPLDPDRLGLGVQGPARPHRFPGAMG